MGASQHINYSSTLTFIQMLQDKYFGEVSVFRNEDGKFIMKLEKTFITGDKKYQQFKQILQFLQSTENKNFAKLMYLENIHESHVCIEYERLAIYTQYFNFTLRGLIINKKDVQSAQLWYCLKSMLEVIKDLQQKNLKINLSLDNIFLNLKGIPQIYLYHLLTDDYKKGQKDNDNSLNSMLKSIIKIILQLATMQEIPEGEQEIQQEFVQKLFLKISSKHALLISFLKQLSELKYQSVEQYLEILQLLIIEKSIKISSQIRFNKFRYVLTDDEKQNKIKNLQIDADTANQQKKAQINNYKTPIYRLNQDFNKSANLKAFFSATNNKGKINEKNQNIRDRNVENNLKTFQSASILNSNDQSLLNQTITKRRINSFSKIKSLTESIPTYEPISIKPRKKILSVASVSGHNKLSQSKNSQQSNKSSVSNSKDQQYQSSKKTNKNRQNHKNRMYLKY